MGERQLREDMATTSTAVAIVPPQLQEEPVPVERVAVITLRPARAQQRKKVVWTDDTVDNENMNKKKSKCCCIYEKPHRFGESDSEDSDDECEHCFGHVERRRARGGGTPANADVADYPAPQPTMEVSLQRAEPAPASPPAPPPPQTDN